MRKSLFVVGLLSFFCALCILVATSVSASERRKKDDDLARERMINLEPLAKGRKLVTIHLNRLQFVLGTPQLTNVVFSRSEEFPHLASVEHKRIEKRISWLESFRSDYFPIGVSGGTSFRVPGKPKLFAICIIFGVEAIQVKQKDGSDKYLAIRPTSAAFMGKFDSEVSKLPRQFFKDHSRKDFLNPNDVDWFFGIKDFSTYRHD